MGTRGYDDGWEFTGNHDLAIPSISMVDGGIHALSVLHRGALGSLSWEGEGKRGGAPLLAPLVREGDREFSQSDLLWERLDRWIPRFRARLDDSLTLEGTICAPGGPELVVPGAVYLLEVENHGTEERELELGFAGGWFASRRMVNTSRLISAPNNIALGGEVSGLSLEMGGEPGLAALALLAADDDAVYLVAPPGAGEAELAPGEVVTAEQGERIGIRISRRMTVGPGKRASFALHLAVAVERDGALARAKAQRRRGARELIRLGRLAVVQLSRRIADPTIGAILNRNLLFNVFFAVGRALDDERLYPVVSRTPLAGVGAIFRERDALLWSLPALQLADTRLARELLLRAFEQYSHRPGADRHYLDGTTLSGEFSLGQFCAYAVALDRYLRDTGDETILNEQIVRQVLEELADLVRDHLHPEIFLGATEVDTGGNGPIYPYLTYDNVLLWLFCNALARLLPPAEGDDAASPPYQAAADEVAAAIWRYCVAEVAGMRLLAAAADLEGEAAVYDDPEASLLLLPAYGFCGEDDPVWRNTLDFLHSEEYPFWHGDRPVPGVGSREHPDLASLPGLCAALIGPRRDRALATLKRLELEGGVASLWYDPETGRGEAGGHHAAAAGLLAWTLSRAVEG